MSELGLALGGGGARGLAHLGILKVLEEKQIKITTISGCSMGAVIGGLYAYYGNSAQVWDFVRNVLKSPSFKEFGKKSVASYQKTEKNYFEQFFDLIAMRLKAASSLDRVSYFDEDETDELFDMIPDVPIEDLSLKFLAIATDLISGQEVNFTAGSLRTALKASAAIPGIFPPVPFAGYLLVDGYASESVPARQAREIGSDRVLAVNVSRKLKTIKQPKNFVEILYRTEDITSFHLSEIRLKSADLILRPKVNEYGWADFDKIYDIIAAGEAEARANIESILQLINRNSYLLEVEHFIKKMKGEM